MPDMFVKPAQGRRVRVPALGFRVLRDEGEFVPDDVFLRRRLMDLDVVRADPPSVSADGPPVAEALPPREPGADAPADPVSPDA